MEKNNSITQDKSHNSSNDDSTLELRQLMQKYVQHWYWFVLAIIISLILATTYLKFSVNKYKTQTTIQLQNSSSSLFSSQMSGLDPLNLMSSGTDKKIEDQIQILSSIKLISQTIDELGIQTEYYKKNKLKYVELYKQTPLELSVSKNFLDTLRHQVIFHIQKKDERYSINFKVKKHYDEKYEINNIEAPLVTPIGEIKLKKTGNIKEGEKYKIIVYSKKVLVQNYKKRLKISTIAKQTNVIELTLVEENIDKGKNILDKIVQLYNKDAIKNKNILAKNTANFIQERLVIVGNQLAEAEASVEKFKRSQNLTNISSEAKIFLETSSDYTQKINELETQRNLMDYVQEYINAQKNQLIPVDVMGKNPSLSVSIDQYNKLVFEAKQLQQTASEENPLLIQMNKEIETLKDNISAGIKNSKNRINITLNDLKRKEAQYKSKIRNIPTQERKFYTIKRQQEIKQNIYLFLLQRQEDIALQLASTEPAARTIDTAYASLNPISPKRKLIYLISLIIGLVIPLIIIYLLDLFKNTIETKEEFRELVKAPFLGSICVSREGKRVVVKEKKSTPIIEMFSLIRTNLQFMIGKTPSPVILVTSTVSGEGKSFTSINLAMSLALTSKKVVLIGLDIRRPKLNEYLEVGENTGISLYLSENINSVDELIVPSIHHPNLDLVPSGPIPPNPAELIMSDRLETLMSELKQRYDYIIVDTAPVGVVTDTYLLDRIADMTIFVSRKGFTPREAMGLVNEISDNNKLKNISVVLNGTNESTEYGYTYGYRKKSPNDFMFKEGINDKLSRIYRKFSKKD